MLPFPGIACGPFEKLQVDATFLPPSIFKHLFGIISKELDCSLLDQNTGKRKFLSSWPKIEIKSLELGNEVQILQRCPKCSFRKTTHQGNGSKMNRYVFSAGDFHPVVPIGCPCIMIFGYRYSEWKLGCCIHLQVLISPRMHTELVLLSQL